MDNTFTVFCAIVYYIQIFPIEKIQKLNFVLPYVFAYLYLLYREIL